MAPNSSGARSPGPRTTPRRGGSSRGRGAEVRSSRLPASWLCRQGAQPGIYRVWRGCATLHFVLRTCFSGHFAILAEIVGTMRGVVRAVVVEWRGRSVLLYRESDRRLVMPCYPGRTLEVVTVSVCPCFGGARGGHHA